MTTFDAIGYARNDGVHLAYQVSGEGPVDLLLVPGFISHVEHAWREEHLSRFLRALGTRFRVVAFDKRGMGLSDRDAQDVAPTREQRVSDAVAVLDATGASRAVLFAWSEGGPTAVALAREHPERVLALVLVGTTARFTQAPGYPEGLPPDLLELAVQVWQAEWGTGVGLPLYAPSLAGDPRFAHWWASYQRAAATPGAMRNALRWQLNVDVRDDLPHLTVPTLVLHRVNDLLIPVACARYIAEHVPGATYRELPGEDHMYWLGDQRDVITPLEDFISQHLPPTVRGDLRRRRRPRPAHGWESLSPAELEVARLVRAGLTNRAIGARLYRSARTVQTQLASVMQKLEAPTRASVAAEVARHESPAP